jgi:succinate dehydrogenase / fumarate reductase flavoprotein subunit
MARNAKGLQSAIDHIKELKQTFWSDLRIPGTDKGPNQALERAGRLADFLELGDLMCRDALHRDESCGCHLREEHQTEDGEVVRNDDKFGNVSVWEWKGEDQPHVLHEEKLDFEALPLMTRSYK